MSMILLAYFVLRVDVMARCLVTNCFFFVLLTKHLELVIVDMLIENEILDQHHHYYTMAQGIPHL